MVTGDNPLTNLLPKAGVDDFIAEAKPEDNELHQTNKNKASS
jgi:high-affinity K+ transport system ATPase subunit B